MSDISQLSRLSYFRVDGYHYTEKTVCDFKECPRPHYCLGYVLEGTAVFNFDGGKAEVKKGDMIFVPVTSRYISVWKGNPDVSYISFHFSFETPSLFEREKEYKIQKITADDDGKTEKRFKKALEFFDGVKSEQLFAISSFFAVLGSIYDELEFSPSKRLDPRIKKAVEYIEDHCENAIAVPQLARLVHMSDSHFYSCFKASVGISPIEYKHRVCAERAMLMLIKYPDLSIEEISDHLGFGSAMHFRKVFKKIVGVSPTAYRKGGRE